jgi:uncharacterized protein YabN with tetrapyrrole methylase and pyrophosphatase domain
LIIVGTGITIGQLTVEALGHIKRADCVATVMDNPVALACLKKIQPRTESLGDFYAQHKTRADTYQEMVNHVMSLLRKGRDVCFVLYGHPGVLARPAHELVRRARAEDFSATMLPGVSAEDCLFADLGVDPGTSGCQSFEATDFLLRMRKFDPCSVLILWQLGVVGESGCPSQPNRENIKILAQTLAKTYPRSHEVIVYDAANYPAFDPVCHKVRLDALWKAPVSPASTLFVPPLSDRPVSAGMRRRLNYAPQNADLTEPQVRQSTTHGKRPTSVDDTG